MLEESRDFSEKAFSEVVVARLTLGHPKLELSHRETIFTPVKGRKIFVGDELFNRSKKSISISLKLDGGPVIFELASNSRLRVRDPQALLGRFQPFFQVVGAGELSVHSKLQDQSLDILAGQLLVRARYGEAKIASYIKGKEYRVRVLSSSGVVKVLRSSNLSSQGLSLQAGQSVVWRTDKGDQVEQNADNRTFADLGLVTPVFAGVAPKETKLQGSSRFTDISYDASWASLSSEGRGLASLGSSAVGALCTKPAGTFQSCLWTCEGSKKGAKDCKVSQPGVYCLRRTCNASGDWSQPTPFASSYRDLCPSNGSRVGACRP